MKSYYTSPLDFIARDNILDFLDKDFLYIPVQEMLEDAFLSLVGKYCQTMQRPLYSWYFFRLLPLHWRNLTDPPVEYGELVDLIT